MLATVFGVAGVAKLMRLDETAASFDALGLPAPGLLARVVPPAELAIAALLAAYPVAGGILAVVALAVFTLIIGRAVHAGSAAPCACFGSARSDPVSARDVARNSMLELLAIGAVAAGEPTLPSLAEAGAVAAAVAGGALLLRGVRARDV